MAKPTRRHLRRNTLVFAGTLAAHVWVIGLVAIRPVSLATTEYRAEPATPITLAPAPKLSKPKPARTPRKAAPRAAGLEARAPAYLSPAPIKLSAGEALEAPIAAPSQAGADDDPIDLAGAAPDLTGAAPAQPRYPINPGYWLVAERWLLLSRTERYCVEPWDIVRFMAAPCNHLYHCDYPVQVIDADRFHFSGVIWRRDERYRVIGGGAYTPTTLHLSASGMGHYRILPFAFSASLDGRFLGSVCPLDAKRIRQAQADPPKTDAATSQP